MIGHDSPFGVWWIILSPGESRLLAPQHKRCFWKTSPWRRYIATSSNSSARSAGRGDGFGSLREIFLLRLLSRCQWFGAP